MNDKISIYANSKLIEKVFLIANVQNITNTYSHNAGSIYNEFFSIKESNEIIINLRKKGYYVEVYYNELEFLGRIINDTLLNLKEWIVFNLARNGSGASKKSLIPAFCDLIGLKYTGANGYSMSISRNKFHVNKLLSAVGLSVPQNWLYEGDLFPDDIPKNQTLIIKPANGSASIGIDSTSIINSNDKEFKQQIMNSYNKNKSPVIIEEFIFGYEAKVPVFVFDKVYAFDPVGISIDNQKFLHDRIITENIAATYKHKKYNLSEVFSNELIYSIKKDAIKIFKLLNMENYGRIDCRITENGKYFFYDFATSPFFVSNSELNFSFDIFSLDMSDILNTIINSALTSKYGYSLK